MSNLKEGQKDLQKEEILQAVVIADDYNNLLTGYTKKKSAALLPVVGKCAIDYALEHLGSCDIKETIIFCSSYPKEVKKHVVNSRWYDRASPMKITFVVSEKCRSLGDAMRDIDHKGLIKGNFILLSALSISNMKLLDIVAFHREKFLNDKGTSMTLILQDVGSRAPKYMDHIFVISSGSHNLLLHLKHSKRRKIGIPLDCLLKNENIIILSNLIDTGIAVCSPNVPILFSDNFDFQTKEDFINGVLLNDEILDNKIYCYQLEGGYGATIQDWESYQRVSYDIMHRWSFPLVPDKPFSNDEPFSQLRKYIYKQSGVQMHKSVDAEMDVVLGFGTAFESPGVIVRSVIGRNCRIGRNVEIRDSFIFDNCTIKDNCKIQLSVLGEGVLVNKSSILVQCFLKKGEIVKQKSNLAETTLMELTDGSKVEGDKRGEDDKVEDRRGEDDKVEDRRGEDDKVEDRRGEDDKVEDRRGEDGKNEAKVGECLDLDSDDGLDPDKPSKLVDPEAEYLEDDFDLSSGSGSEESYVPLQEDDDTSIFYTEVVESLLRGFEEKLPCENLVLEINSSRYAYNVLLKDVTKLTVKAIFSIPKRVGSNTKPVLTHFLPLFKNYVKSPESQMDCLCVMEEMFEELENELTKSVHFLYQNDILLEDVILKWHKNLEEGSPVASKIAPLIKWLEEAAEESSEGDK